MCCLLITSTNIVIKLREQYPYKNFPKERLLCAWGTKSGSRSFADRNNFYAYSFKEDQTSMHT